MIHTLAIVRRFALQCVTQLHDATLPSFRGCRGYACGFSWVPCCTHVAARRVGNDVTRHIPVSRGINVNEHTPTPRYFVGAAVPT